MSYLDRVVSGEGIEAGYIRFWEYATGYEVWPSFCYVLPTNFSEFHQKSLHVYPRICWALIHLLFEGNKCGMPCLFIHILHLGGRWYSHIDICSRWN
jgi:hypothetical protein